MHIYIFESVQIEVSHVGNALQEIASSLWLGIHLGPEELKESMSREPTRLELKVANLCSAEVFCLPLRIFRHFKISVPRFFFLMVVFR